MRVMVVKTWDLNYSQDINWQEFQLGPLLLVLLQHNKPLLKKFSKNAPGNADSVTQVRLPPILFSRFFFMSLRLSVACVQLFRSELGSYISIDPGATMLLEGKRNVACMGKKVIMTKSDVCSAFHGLWFILSELHVCSDGRSSCACTCCASSFTITYIPSHIAGKR